MHFGKKKICDDSVVCLSFIGFWIIYLMLSVTTYAENYTCEQKIKFKLCDLNKSIKNNSKVIKT